MNKSKKKISVRLPNKLHAMLTKALDDVERLEKSKKYKINMGVAMQRRNTGEVCEVCLGGSQLVGKLPSGRFTWWFDERVISSAVCKKLMALDCLRTGDVTPALNYLDRDAAPGPGIDRHVVDYHEQPKIWKAQMRLLAAELEEANL